MAILLSIYTFILKIIYSLFKLRATKDSRIVFLSRQSNKPSIDFLYLINDIKKRYPDYEVIVLTKRMEKTNIRQICNYLFHPLKQMWYVATASVCIIDGYQIVISCLKHKKGLKVIQIWHSLGAIKKFGYQTLKTKKDKRLAKVMKMHHNYNYIVAGSKTMVKYFARAFNYSEKYFISCGLPRIDYLRDTKKSNREKVYKMYPELRSKKVVLYAPTFRIYDEYKIDELIKIFKNSEYELIIKIHPRMHNLNVPSKYTYDNADSLSLLSVADCIITDYSAISIEAAILDVPVFLYTYDYDKYNSIEGINTDLEDDLPGYVFKDAKKLFNCLKREKYDKKILKKYREKYVTIVPGGSTKTLVDFIINLTKNN